MRVGNNINPEIKQEKRNTILAALSKATGEVIPSYTGTGEPDDQANSYYTLSKDQIEALISGDMEKIEYWVINMDRNHATKLLCWLIKDR